MDLEQQERLLTPGSVSQPALGANLPTAAGSTIAVWPAPSARPVMPMISVEAQLRRRWLRRLAGRLSLFLLDALMLNVAFIVAYYLRYQVLRDVTFTTAVVDIPLGNFRLLEVLVTVGALGAFALRGLYRLRTTSSWFRQFWIVTSATTTAFAAFSAFDYVVRKTDLGLDNASRALVIFTWVAVIVAVGFARLCVAGMLGTLFRRGHFLTNLLVVGSGRLGKLMMQQIAASPQLGYRVIGFIHDLDGPPADFGRFKALGTMRDLDAVIRGYRISDVIIALPSHQHQQILRTVRLCERAGADFRLVPDLYELSLSRIGVDAIEGIPLIGLRRSLTNTWQYRVKRLMDIAIAGTLLLVGSPVWLLLALAIKLDSPGPIFYRTMRLGYRGAPFRMFKFRSMHINADAMLAHVRTPEGDERGKFKLRRDPRRTRVGRFIRATSLDEIPQLINVLRGDMSIVGPRPPEPSEVERYEDWEKARLEMPAGITGLWQVRGRSDLDFNEMVLMDLYYIENWNLRLDLQILLKTIPAVILRRGAY